MVVYEDYSGRVKEIRTYFKMNKAEFAEFTKTHASILSEYESGNREPSKEFIKTLSKIGISTDWFLTGNGEMIKPNNRLNEVNFLHQEAEKSASKKSANGSTATRQKPPGVPLVYEGDSELEDGIVIPLLENAVSAGYGSDPDEDDVPARYVRVPRYLAKYPHLASLPVKGDSMEPTLHDGDLVVCDGGGWDGDGMYVLKSADKIYVKRLLFTSKGYQVVSDNKMYPDYTESEEEMSIVGKVRAVLAMIPGRRGGI